jgi:hypothetical protein
LVPNRDRREKFLSQQVIALDRDLYYAKLEAAPIWSGGPIFRP